MLMLGAGRRAKTPPLQRNWYPIGRREVPKLLGTGVLVTAPPKLAFLKLFITLYLQLQ
jgi:hypothetical protein